MSDVERYWEAIAKKFGDDRAWHQLNRQQQDIIIQSINMLLAVLNRQI